MAKSRKLNRHHIEMIRMYNAIVHNVKLSIMNEKFNFRYYLTNNEYELVKKELLKCNIL